MKYLIISDIHNHVDEAQRIIDSVPCDLVVLLGDYFDNFGDTPKDVERAALWVLDKLSDPRFILLFGNHDIAYAFPSRHTFCSGWEELKHKTINDILNRDAWSKIRPCLYVKDGNWLLSHAGAAYDIFKDDQGNITPEWVELKCASGLSLLSAGKRAVEFGAGRYRGGDQYHGGITWQDFSELLPQKEFRQIVGHTPSWKEPQVKFYSSKDQSITLQQTWNRFNGWDHQELSVCMDTHNDHYVILEDGHLQIYRNKFK